MITLDRLQQIIPADQALANKALSVALSQVTGIKNVQLPAFANTVSGIQTTRDLPLITALTTAVPPSVANYYTSTLATGGGSNGDIRITDIIGLAAGWIATDGFTRTVELFATMDLSYLTTIYTTMYRSLNGSYGPTDSGPLVIPGGLPCAGTYTGTEVEIEVPNPNPPPPTITITGYDPSAISLAMSCLTGAAATEIAALELKYPAQTTELNTIWNNMAAQVPRERAQQAQIGLNYANFQANDRNSIYGFIFSLPDYGLQSEVGGMAWFVEAMADIGTQAGQAVIASLRQGRNNVLLGNAGIYTNTKIPATPIPPPPQAELLPADYTEAEASALVKK
jgi:hypothetical protein